MGAWEDTVDREFVRELVEQLREASSENGVKSAWELPPDAVKSIVLELIDTKIAEI